MFGLAKKIAHILLDYHSYRGFQFTPDHILDWVNQFDEYDREFILTELLHLLSKGIYISEQQARNLLIRRIESLAREFDFAKTTTFLEHADFLAMQPKGKSQQVLLTILDEELQKNYNFPLAHSGSKSRKYAIYLDDVLATGGTVFADSLKWLRLTDDNDKSNLDKVINGEIVFIVSLFCLHNWANVGWRLKTELKNDSILKKIRYRFDYEIQNHPTFTNQKLNFFYPLADQPESIIEYFQQLDASSNEGKAFRKPGTPVQEGLFSSAENRIRLENIFLKKGVELLQKTQNLKPNHRPLGATFPSYKTLGTGTLFFTWRNIPNTSPVVFWWAAGGWFPLFPLNQRGLAI